MLLRHDGSYRNRVGTLISVQSIWQCPSILGLMQAMNYDGCDIALGIALNARLY